MVQNSAHGTLSSDLSPCPAIKADGTATAPVALAHLESYVCGRLNSAPHHNKLDCRAESRRKGHSAYGQEVMGMSLRLQLDRITAHALR